MKRVLLIAVGCIAALVLLSSCSIVEKLSGEKNETSEKKDVIMEEKVEGVKYTEYEDLTEAFMEICRNGDVEGMYSLYYDDYLTKMVDKMVTDQSQREDFDAALAEEMATIVDYVEYPYGCPELPHATSPLGYANQIYAAANGGSTLPLTDNRVTDCVDLRVFRDDGTYRDHFMVAIDGYWYFVV